MDAEKTFVEWRDTLCGFCGNFDVTPGEDLKVRHGSFGEHLVGGLEMSHITTNYDAIRRDQSCIRRDDMDCFYLMRQLRGSTGIVSDAGEVKVFEGDSILLDSARPLEGFYGREGVEFVSLHVPREALFREAGDGAEIECGVPRRMDDPRNHALQAALKYLDDKALADDEGRGFVVDLARLVFRRDPRPHSYHRFSQQSDRGRALAALIHRHASDPGFALADLARLSGMSERQVQRDLHSLGTSFSRELLASRMDLVRRQLMRAARQGDRPRVAQIAYGAGFNDLSNFNRSFLREHGCSPLEFARQASPA